jgi:hypothetical protein
MIINCGLESINYLHNLSFLRIDCSQGGQRVMKPQRGHSLLLILMPKIASNDFD